MKQTRLKGFTILELMVVLAIIGVLMSMATLSVNQRESLEESQEFAQTLTLYMNALRDEASFQNLDLGLLMDVKEIQLLSYTPEKPEKPRPVNPTQPFANLEPQPQSEKKDPWQPYKGRLKAKFKTPEHVFLRLELEGREIDFNKQIGNNESFKPALLFLSSDEYTPFKLFIEHEQDQGFSVIVTGDGLSSFQVQTELLDDEQ